MTIKENDILVAEFGYEANLARFYKVLRRTEKTVVLQRVEKRRISGGNFLDGWQTVPTGEAIGKPFRRKVQPDGCVIVSSVEYAWPWDGESVEEYNWH